jgi:hypothetical protein
VPKELTGRWEGTIQLVDGSLIRLVIRVAPDPDGRLEAFADSPDQQTEGLPITHMTLKDSVWTWSIALINAHFEGKATTTGDTYTGEFRQRIGFPERLLTSPLTLERTGQGQGAQRP